MEREKAIDVIRKLIRLQESPNENEAALAAAKASELLMKYNLTMKDVSERGSESEMVIVKAEHTFATIQQWIIILSTAVASHMYCKVYYQREIRPLKSQKHSAKRRYASSDGVVRGVHNTFNFYGRRANAEVAAFMFDQLFERLTKLASVRSKEYGKFMTRMGYPARTRVGKSTDGRSYRAAWLAGACSAIYDKLREIRTTLVEDPDAKAIVMLRDTEVEEAFEQFSRGMKQKKNKIGLKNSTGWRIGTEDGRNIEINPGLNTEETDR